MEGTLRRAGERWQLRFIRTLPYPPEKVWRALTEPEHLAAWFPSDIEGDRGAGAKLRFVFRNGEGPPSDGEGVQPVATYDPGATRWTHVWPGGRTMGAPSALVNMVTAPADGLVHVPLTI